MDYRVLIVDDEPLIRQGIRNKLDWKLYNIEQLAEACDGIDALEKIRMLNPEIVITDIKMPEIDGLLLIKQANEEGYFPYFIIISGYAEFAYAKKAITFGVEDYLLKPIQAGELATVIQRIMIKIEHENTMKQKFAYVQDDLNPSLLREVTEKNTGEEIVREVVNFIDHHYQEEITLKSMAQKYFINENYCCRIFKIINGKSFNDYLTEVRMNKACELLKKSKFNITEIAELVGYESKYFSKVFKKEIGMCPIEYLEKNRDE